MSAGCVRASDGETFCGWSGDEPRSLRPFGILMHCDKDDNKAKDKEKYAPDYQKPCFNHTGVGIVMFRQGSNYVKEYHRLKVLLYNEN